MAQLAPVVLDDELVIYVETRDDVVIPGGSRILPAGAEDAAERAIQTSSRLTDAVVGMSKRVVDSFRRLDREDRPVTAEVVFGLDISVEGTVYVVKGSGNGSVTIRAQWRLTPDDDEPR